MEAPLPQIPSFLMQLVWMIGHGKPIKCDCQNKLFFHFIPRIISHEPCWQKPQNPWNVTAFA